MKPTSSLSPGYFEGVYAADADPWQFETSAYEHAKYEATLAALPQQRYRDALEIGCSIGVLTAQLALRCDRLLAVDVNDSALQQARRRCAGQPQASFANLQVPQQFPPGSFDLVLLSEVGYYWSRDDLALAATRIIDALLPNGHLVLVHWTAPVDDYPLDGDEVHELFLARAAGGALRHVQGSRQPQYRLDAFERTAGP